MGYCDIMNKGMQNSVINTKLLSGCSDDSVEKEYIILGTINTEK